MNAQISSMLVQDLLVAWQGKFLVLRALLRDKLISIRNLHHNILRHLGVYYLEFYLTRCALFRDLYLQIQTPGVTAV